MLTSPKHIIFDLDGTLVDSASVIASVLNEMRADRGLPGLEANGISKWVSLGANSLIGNSLHIEESNSIAVADALAEFRSRYASMPTPMESVYDGVLDLLVALTKADIRLSLCTNKPRPLSEKVLTETGLGVFFPFVCAGGDLPHPKPDPANALACMGHYGTSATDTWLVGDSTIDQQCALNAGARFIFHSRGYDDGVDTQHCLISFDDYRYFKSFVLTS